MEDEDNIKPTVMDHIMTSPPPQRLSVSTPGDLHRHLQSDMAFSPEPSSWITSENEVGVGAKVMDQPLLLTATCMTLFPVKS